MDYLKQEADQKAFEEAYAKRSGVTVEWLRQHRIALPCQCGEPDCEGWAMVSRAPHMIEAHLNAHCGEDT